MLPIELFKTMLDNQLMSKTYVIDSLFGLITDIDKNSKMKFGIVNDNTFSSSV